MGNKFDMISANESGSINNLNLLNETFHVFSKSPASNVTTLGGARMKSGHTTTTSDVWADAIPAFFNAANQTKFDYFSTLAEKDDLCIFDGKVYQHNGTEFVSLGTIDEVLTDGKEFSKNNKPVIKYHKNRPAINLTADNNNGDGANNLSARIYDAAEGSTNFVPQFISSTDKMVGGVPSLSYDASVVAGGVKLAEGLTNDNDYICNAYAGVIQFNKERSSGVTVSAWEYIGAKLDATVAKLTAAVFGSNDGETGEQPTDLVTQVNINTGDIAVLKGSATEEGSIAYSIKTAIDGLGDVAVKSDITITDIKVKVGSGEATSLVPTDKSVTIEIPEVPAATVTTEGVITTDGFAKASDAKAIAEKAINVSLTDTTTTGAIGKAIADAKKEALDAIGGIYHFNVKVVDALPTSASELVENTIYLVPEEDKTSGNYVEYIAYKPEGSETVTTERIGTTAVDLEGYTTDTEYEALAGETGRVTVVEGKVKTLEETTIPAIQKSVTDLTTTVGDNKAAIERALSDAVAEIGQTTAGLDSRLQTAEGSIKTVVEETIPAVQKSVTDGVAEAKSHAETKATEAKEAAEKTASDALAAARTEITEEIAAAQQAAIDGAKVTLTQGTGIVVTPNSSTSFTVAVDDTIATVAETTALSEVIASNKAAIEQTVSELTDTVEANKTAIEQSVESTKTELEGKITAASTAASTALETAKTEIKGTTDGLDSRLTDAEAIIESLTEGDSSVDKKIETAVSAAQSTLQANIDALASTEEGKEGRVTVAEGKIAAIETSLATGGETANAIKAAQDAADAAQKDATQALADAAAAKTEGTEAKTAVTTLSTTAVAEQSVTGSGISVTLGGEVGAPTLTGSVTTATYTPATADTAGAWSDETNVVTGATVKTALTDVTNAHKKDIETLEQSIEEALEQHTADIETVTAAVNALSTSGFSRVVVTELPTENINLNAIYLIANKESDANEYIEYIYVGEVGSGRFEQIGTTKTDLAEYAKTSEVEEAIATATQTTTLVSEGALTAPATADENKFVTASGIYTAIATAKSEVISSLEVTAAGSNGIELGYADGALTLTVTPGVVEAGNDSVVTGGAVATAIMTAIEALDVAETTQNGITFSQTDGEVSISVTVGEVVADNTSVVTGGAVAQAITDASDAINDKIDALDATETVNGITVTQVDGKITGITEELIVASVPAETTSVEGNVAYVGSTKHVIAPEKFQTAAQMPETLTSWVADLSNLTVGDGMFANTALTTFIGDLSSLTSGVDMFTGCSLTVESVEFIADTLPTVTSGTITLGNRTDAHDEAVAEIEAKGWTVA